MITKKRFIVEKLKMLDETNASQILDILEDLHDEEGKNAPIIALEENLLNAFHIMINPVRTKNGYKIYYDPFNNGVVRGTKPLTWNMLYNLDQITFPTRTKFYSIYSPYSYLENMDIDLDIKRILLNDCHELDHDIIKNMTISNIPLKDKNKYELYTDEDIIRYIPIPLQNIARDLVSKNIPIISYNLDRFGYLEIIIEYEKLSEENKEIVKEMFTELNGNFLITKNNYQLHIDYISKKDEKIEVVEEELNNLLGRFKYQPLDKYKISVDEAYKRTIRFLLLIKRPIDDELSKIELCQKINPLLTLSSDGTFFYEHPSVKERDEQITNKKKGE